MSTAEDEPSSGLNGRLRPRKSGSSPQTTKALRKLDSKVAQDKPKKNTAPSKATPIKADLTVSEESLSKFICAFCDETFISKQSITKHVRRVHLLSSSQDYIFNCLFCKHTETDADGVIRHMTNNHPNQYFACHNCHTRFLSTTELAEHKLNVCEKQKLSYRKKLRQKSTSKKNLKATVNSGDNLENNSNNLSSHSFNGIVISCELKSSHPNDSIDIEDNITTNLILPSNKNLANSNVIEKNAIIVLDDLQWNKRIPHNFSFHNTDTDQILSRLGVVHRSPRTGDSNKKDWLKHIDDSNQKFEKCFDTSFYSKVASNVQENLMKFLDGSFNFNPDPENTIKTRKAKNCVAINTVEGFPILLAAEQFRRNVFDGYMPRTIAPKHKWKWDNLESEKNLSPEQIKRDSHANNCIISLVSSLDIWTQLCMRRKFEDRNSRSPSEKRIDKQSIIGQELKEILESRELPATSSQVVNYKSPTPVARGGPDFPSSLGLVRNGPNLDLKPAVLSGEWVRPRCYVCCACGAQSQDSKALSSHISSQHPNAQIQHYEIVGEVLLNSDILKHLYVPPSQQSNRTRPLRGIRECTKCQKSISLDDLHQHMLDCAGDAPPVRRKCRYRPFGVRKRRQRLQDNTIRQELRQDIRHSRHNQKTHLRPRQKIRTEVGDADTIRRMLADLPAKRHRVLINPTNTILRPRKKLCQRAKLLIKKRTVEEIKRKSYFNDVLQDNDLNTSEYKTNLPDNEKTVPHNRKSVKRVASKILSQRSLNKKNIDNKGRRKPSTGKEVTDKNSSGAPAQRESGTHINQLSAENNSQRVNINDNNGSFNTRQQSNPGGSNNGSEDNLSSGSSEPNNSRDCVESSPHTPLKHSIANLTANAETHDKSIQFHHMFLVQQECNNTTRHSQSGQRTYFESEAVVTKLDKPPLHYDQQEALDSNFLQRLKLNKPRKGLNDCIAMLRNKLVEPNSETEIFTEHVSVQCGSDEPLEALEALEPAPPAVIERRHSATESNMESTQRALQMFNPNNTVEEPQCCDPSPQVTHLTNTHHINNAYHENFLNHQPTAPEYMHWNQYYYKNQLMPLNNSVYKYNSREPIRRRSVVTAEEILLQQAINYEMMANSNRNLCAINEYQFHNLPIAQKPARRTRQDTYKTRSNTNNRVTKPKTKESKPRQRKTTNTRNSQRRNSHNKLPEVDPQLLQRVDATHSGHIEQRLLENNLTATSDNIAQYYLQGVRLEDGTYVHHGRDNPLMPLSTAPEQPPCPIMYQNMSLIPYPKECNIIPVRYEMLQDTSVTAPLDLTNKIAAVEESIRYNTTEDQYPKYLSNSFETLDLSNKNSNPISASLVEREICSNPDVVVDLSVHNSSLLSYSSNVPTELSSNNLQDNATDLSCHQDDVPTDLSMKTNEFSRHIYDKRAVYDNFEINMIHDLSHPSRQEQEVRMITSQEDRNEEPTDLSFKRNDNILQVPASSLLEESQMHLNVYRNETIISEQDMPADLSNRNFEIIRNNYYTRELSMQSYKDPVVSNDELTMNNCIDLRLPHKTLTLEEMRNVQYNIDRANSLSFNSLEPRTLISYSPQFLKETPNMVSLNLNETPIQCSLPVAINSTPINQSGIRNDVAYMMTEMPLSLCTRRISDSWSNPSDHDQSLFRDDEYHNRTPTSYSLTQYEEPINASIISNNNTTLTSSAVDTTSEMLSVSRSGVPSVMHKSHNIDKRKLSDEREDLEAKKYIPTDTSADHTYQTISINNNINNLKTDFKVYLEQNPEAAKKIAMLPKQLVEILETIPAGHRNQLLDILPQYVTSTSSPVLFSNTESYSQALISSSTLLCSQTQTNFKKGYTSDDNRMLVYSMASQNAEPTAVTISSSVLLTPPTPQLSDRQSNQSFENEELQAIEYRRKSISIEEQTSLQQKNFENLSATTQTSLLKKAEMSNDHTEQNRIIDLTKDEVSTEVPDVHRLESSTKIITNTSKDILNINSANKNVLKVTNDKTASLRAVRIKTTSERQRSIAAENTLLKKHSDMTEIVIEEQYKINNCEIIASKAIQQAEVSSTQHRSATMSSPRVNVRNEKTSVLPFKDNNQIPSDGRTTTKANYTFSNVPRKKNIVSSSYLKEKKSHLKEKSPCDLQKNASLKKINFINDVNQTSVVETDCKLGSQISKQEDSNINMEVDESTSVIYPMEEDDSDDDVSLAVIVKQKQDLIENESQKIERIKSKKEVNNEPNIKTIDNVNLEEKNIPVPLNNRKSPIVDVCDLHRSKLRVGTAKDTNNLENCDKEKTSNLNKKGKKGRRTNVVRKNNLEEESGMCISSGNNCIPEINEENNVMEVSKNLNIVEDPIDFKQSEIEVSLSTTNNKIISNKTEASSNTNKLEKNSFNVTVETIDNKNESTVRNSKVDSLCESQKTSFNNFDANKEHKTNDSNAINSGKNAPKCDKVLNYEVNDSIIQAEVNNIIEHIDSYLKKSEKNTGQRDSAETEECNILPVRRSRRGKSLFVDSTATNDSALTCTEKACTENITEHRAPLTKKEIIFSKLLQDEENYNKAEKLMAVTISDKQNKPQDDINNIEINQEQNTTIHVNKRKTSPQSRNKCKKQRPIEQRPISSIDEKATKSKLIDVVDNKETKIIISHTPDIGFDESNQNLSLKIDQISSKDNHNIGVCTTGKHAKIIIEKRKSSDKDELQISSNPKKYKLNEELPPDLHKNIKKHEKQANSDESKIKSITSINTRNTTCYNKAIRRARSKSVGVKSSKYELYDPYDIDLEEMVDKTEPLVSKEISPKISFNTFKSKIATKSRKSNNITPSMNKDVLSSQLPTLTDSDRSSLIANSQAMEKNNNSAPKEGFSDSDESSKSDVPLKIFVEEKERKLMITSLEEMEISNPVNANTNLKLSKTRKRCKKSKQSKSENHETEKQPNNKTENEDELRSEQFMESFGFFSERKPRKSNLLASKKIAETFNLIENDELYYAPKELNPKKPVDEKKENKIKVKPPSLSVKKITKRGRKKKIKMKPSFCNICKRAFRRLDNYVRHLMSIFHVSKLCEVELKVKTILVQEEPNYLLVYRQQLNRLKVLQNKIANRKKNCLSTSDIVLPTLEQILEDVKRTVQEQISRRRLSRDEALFVDCCEMLKSFNAKQKVRQCNSFNCERACQEELVLLDQSIRDDRCDIKDDDDMDSVTAKKIMDSEEVRNLENDLITNLKEGNGLTGPLNMLDSRLVLSSYGSIEESSNNKYKPHPKTKERLYPDVPENIFENKFDQIKRKKRSQAVAAKQTQTHIEINARCKDQKKSEKKKAKRNFKKIPNTVPTKAALKGFEGIKVSILTSEIDLSSIVPSIEKPHRKKKKRSSKKKRNRKLTERSCDYEKSINCEDRRKTDEKTCSKEVTNKKVDVYEFMDDDSEILELRPTTLTDRFKINNNKDLPTTSKSNKDIQLAEISSESGSDGDDFVYMSDDYVCSDDENSVLSCELSAEKGINELKKTSSPLKRKDATEKNTVMGKIFKHNAVRSDRRSPKIRDFVKPTANLDQLFDSLLEDEPKTNTTTKELLPEKKASLETTKDFSKIELEKKTPEKHEQSQSSQSKYNSSLTKKNISSKDDLPPPSRVYLSLSPPKGTFEKESLAAPSRVYLSLAPQKDDLLRHDKKLGRRFDQSLSITGEIGLTQKYSTPSPTLHPSLSSFSTRRTSATPPKKMELNVKSIIATDPATIKENDDKQDIEAIKKSDQLNDKKSKILELSLLTKDDKSDKLENSKQGNDDYLEKQKSKDKVFNNKSDKKKKMRDETDKCDNTGETLDFGAYDDTGVARQRIPRKCAVGKQNVLAETWSSESEPDGAPPRPNSVESVIVANGRKKRARKREGMSSNRKSKFVSTKKQDYDSRVGSNRAAASGSAARPHYWSEGEDEQEHPQQHGWIVGDSHKKLVTMLAHAKGRKRSAEEKRTLIE